jgi:hypothetical protein
VSNGFIFPTLLYFGAVFLIYLERLETRKAIKAAHRRIEELERKLLETAHA